MIEIYDKFMNINFAVFSVPEGEEQTWIETLESEEIIRYAQLNHIIQLRETTLPVNQGTTEDDTEVSDYEEYQEDNVKP